LTFLVDLRHLFGEKNPQLFGTPYVPKVTNRKTLLSMIHFNSTTYPPQAPNECEFARTTVHNFWMGLSELFFLIAYVNCWLYVTVGTTSPVKQKTNV